MSFILFDVGANWGTDSLHRTRDNPEIMTYAFEPTPELARHLRHSSVEFSTRYRVFDIALSDYNGKAEFNVSAHEDWGTSSLLAFNKDLHETWPGRHDLYVDRKITVDVMRFDTWFCMTETSFSKIDFFHCDTQGTDLKVLHGMGDCFEMIVEGVVEAPESDHVKLYQGQHSKEEVYDFLADRGYEVFRVEPQQNELNLFFRRKAR